MGQKLRATDRGRALERDERGTATDERGKGSERRMTPAGVASRIASSARLLHRGAGATLASPALSKVAAHKPGGCPCDSCTGAKAVTHPDSCGCSACFKGFQLSPTTK